MSLARSFKDTATLAGILGGAVIAIGLVAGTAAGEMGLNPLLTAPESAKNTLVAQGFKDVEIKGYGWLACGFGENTDLLRTSFTAVNANDQKVAGTVCEGLLFKGATIRGLQVVPK